MQTHTPKAVWVVAALSLLLGLSLGQVHRLHQKVQHLEKGIVVDPVILTVEAPLPHPDLHRFKAEMHMLKEKLHADAERLRALQEIELAQRQVIREE